MVVVEGFVLMMMIINQNLDFQGLRSVHPSSTRGLTQQHSVRNMLFEYIHGVGTGQSYGKFTMTSSISVVEKVHCDDILLIHRYRWCLGRRIWDPGKLQAFMKQLHHKIKMRRSILGETNGESFKIYISIQYIWYRNMDKSALSLKPYEAFLLYGDVLIVVEIESIYWIQNWKISIVLNWDKINIIQQKEVVFMMRCKFKARRRTDRVDTLSKKKTVEEKHIYKLILLI
ncbi:hypothetical protein IGI04_009238 [Brassica rapa subsp. trilocularis]|uniref:Uncharacterized protein n=1 Tax=Brassica rapa subsp. trilocularis TaxID=1813537 RepID=A0ABQ7MWQ7_BRACM|nr:hypothetical protein IGI04_009238 [Brassica rapa subsp. trilocularis]